jgi:DNA mismatch endonuclease, patch repair protein
MTSTRQKDTKPEVLLRTELHQLGLRYRLHQPVVPGVRRRPDIVFGPAKVAVFVDGCFWHGCPEHGTTPKANAAFWAKKISDNRRRDADTNERLEVAGWKVIRVWEHDDPCRAAKKIEQAVRRRR